jgi:hypothetical protein
VVYKVFPIEREATVDEVIGLICKKFNLKNRADYVLYEVRGELMGGWGSESLCVVQVTPSGERLLEPTMLPQELKVCWSGGQTIPLSLPISDFFRASPQKLKWLAERTMDDHRLELRDSPEHAENGTILEEREA